MAVVVNDNTKCQIDRTNKFPPTSVSSPPPLDLGMEVREVEPVEIEVCVLSVLAASDMVH